MRAEAIIRASQAVAALERASTKIAEISIPTKITAQRQNAVLAAQAAAVVDAKRAVQLLQKAEFAPGSIQDMQRATQLLRDAPLAQSPMRSAGAELTTVSRAAIKAHSEILSSARIELATSILRRPAEQMSARQLRAIADLAGDRTLHEQFTSLQWLKPADIEKLAAGELTIRAALQINRAHVAVKYADDGAGALAAIHRLIDRDPSQLSTQEWSTLTALLEHEHVVNQASGPFKLPDGEYFQELASWRALEKKKGSARDIDRFFAAWRLSTSPITEGNELVRSIFTKDPATITKKQWQTITALMDLDSERKYVIIGPMTYGYGADLYSHIIQMAYGKRTSIPSDIRRLFATWKLIDASESERNALIRSFIDKGNGKLTKQDWNVLSAAISAQNFATTSTTVQRHTPFALEGAQPFEYIATRIADGEMTANAISERYFSVHRQLDIPIEQRTEALRRLVKKDPGRLSQREWNDLGGLGDLALMDPNPVAPYKVAGTMLGREAAAVAAGYSIAHSTRRHFAAMRMAEVPPSERSAQAAELMSRKPSAQTTDDWKRLAAIVDLDGGQGTLPGPTQINGLEYLEKVVSTLAYKRPSKISADIERYRGAWEVGAQTSVEERTRLTDTLMKRDPHSLSNNEWRTLTALLDLNHEGEQLPVNLSLDDGEHLASYAASLANGNPMHELIPRHFNAWKASEIPLSQRRTEVVELIAKHPAELTREQWQRLAALLDSDSATKQLPGSPPLEYGESLGGFAFYRGQGKGFEDIERLDQIFRMARILDMPDEQRVAVAKELFSRDPHTLSTDDWKAVSALVESNSDHLLPGPYYLSGSPTLRQLLPKDGAVPEITPVIERYFVKWHQALDYEGFTAAFQHSLDAVRAGNATQRDKSLIGASVDLYQLIIDQPVHQRLAVAETLLGIQSVVTNIDSKYVLEDLEHILLKGGDLPPIAERLRPETLRLVRSNLLRLQGVVAEGATEGYRYHPEYSELGRIRSNLMLMNREIAAAQRPAEVAAPGVLRW